MSSLKNNSRNNIYYGEWCKIHDEHEPYEHDDGYWHCPKCARKLATLEEIIETLEKIKNDNN